MTIVTIVSWLIMVFVGVVTVFCIFEEKDIKKQMNAALVLLPIVPACPDDQIGGVP